MNKTKLIRRIIITVLAASMLAGATAACAEGGLPSFSEVAGYAMPSLGEALQRYPDSETSNEDGSVTERYTQIGEEEYMIFSSYLNEQNAEVADYKVENAVLTAEIRANGASFFLRYDSSSNEAEVTYPAGTYNNRMRNAETHLTEAENLLRDGNPDEAYAELLEIPQYHSWEAVDRLLQDNQELRMVPYRTIGGTVYFGLYEQDNNLENGTEEIEWTVLDYDAENHKTLLISKYGLDAVAYHNEFTDITWEKCSLRTWLNNAFLNGAFDEKERNAILTTDVDNSAAQGNDEWKTKGGKNTQDQIFLLSFSEAKCYLDVESGTTNKKAVAAPTPYAISRGTFANDGRWTGYGAYAWRWWLRSPGSLQNSALTVEEYGNFFEDGVSADCVMVRPALWLDLNADVL